jgi:bifunctional DNA-binding transcriptional regulator/antitoxin component of YhaV-PrlF toxin-antitoxin module
MSMSYVMKVSSNGQVSIPADARARWHPDRMLVVDLGDRLVMRPLPEDPVGALTGKYKRGPSTDEVRRRAREEDAAAERRKRR